MLLFLLALPALVFPSPVSAKPTATIAVPSEWKEIDRLNRDLKKAKKPVSTEKFAAFLQRGSDLARNEALEQHYQRVKEKAFLRDNFKEADGFSRRAKPAFTVNFSDDYDTYALDFPFFLSLTAPGTPERDFLDFYRKYADTPHVDLTKDGLSRKGCFLPFHLPAADGATEKDALVKELETVSLRLGHGFLFERAKTFLHCLNPRPLVESVSMVDLPARQKMVQAIINGKELAPYLRPELQGRVPLVVSEALVGSELELSKFGQKVKMAKESELSGAFLRFLAFDCNAEKYCNISFEYPIEGVRGSTGAFVGADGSVSLEKTSVREVSKP